MKARHTLLFMVAVIALLGLLCVVFPKDGITIGDKHLHFASLEKILTPKQELNLDSLMAVRAEAETQLNSLKDSIVYYEHHIDSSDLRFWFPGDDPAFFDEFFQKAEQARENHIVVRVLHYGDSQIEMDRISSRLRSYMQRHFGGGGPGMVPIQTIIPSYAISQYAQGNLSLQTCFGDSLGLRANGNYGPMVQCFRLVGDASADFKASQHAATEERVKHFSTIKLLFNNRPGPLTATLTDRKHNIRLPQEEASQEGVEMFCWELDSCTESLRLSLHGSADIYGVMLDDGPGVSVDNIPMRGCSGQQFSMINKQQLEAAYNRIDVGLIIMQFGGNSVPYLHPGKSLETYCKSMGKQIDRLHEVCPGARILFVGPSDMSTSVSGALQTYPAMESIISSLRDTVLSHGAAYWSIYHAMGGHNSMLAWVSKGWAGSDYIHFSSKGADLMGDLMADAFDRIYTYYRLRRQYLSKQQQYDSTYEE